MEIVFQLNDKAIAQKHDNDQIFEVFLTEKQFYFD